MGIINIAPASLSGMRFLFSFYGLSETGKTLSALRVAAGLEPDPRKRMLLDTEGGQRGRAYVNEIAGGYLYASLSPPYTPERYIQALNEIEAAGVSVLVTDSASHSWFAEGGILAMVEESALKNDMAKWKDPKRRLGKMMQRYRSSDMHHILCSRAKQPLIEAEVNGRKAYVPGPVIPIQEKMMRYDMTVIAHMVGRGKFTVEAPAGKCPSNLLPIFAASELMNEDTGRRLAEWINVRGTASPEVRALRVQASEAAAQGMEAYGAFWAARDRTERAALFPEHDNLKSVAQAADDERARNAGDAESEARAERERSAPALDDPFGRAGIELAREDPFGLPPLPAHEPQPHSPASPPTGKDTRSALAGPDGTDLPEASTAEPAGEPQRDLLGDPPAADLYVPLPRDPKPKDWEYWRRQMDAAIGGGENRAGIKLQNEAAIAAYKVADFGAYSSLMESLAKK